MRTACKTLFTGPAPSQLSNEHLKALTTSLAPLRDALVAAGHPNGLEPLLSAALRQKPLSDLAATGTRAGREDVAAALTAFSDSMVKALGPGRDGAELVSLYGQNPGLDQLVDGLRTGAMSRFMLSHEAKAQGHADASSLPPETHAAVHAAAAELTKREREIAQTKQHILRTMSPSKDGFVPSLGGLRFTPPLAEGMQRANSATTRKAGVLVCALLAKEEALAASPAGQRLHGAVKGQLASAAKEDVRYLQQRAGALTPQQLATGLSSHDTAALKLSETDAKKTQETMLSLAGKGFAGVGEVQDALAAANQTLGKVKANAARLEPVNAEYTKAFDVERGNILASGLLARLAGSSKLEAGGDAESNAQLRAGLTRPNSPLGMLVDPRAPGRERLGALATRYDALAKTVQQAEGELLVTRLDTFSGPIDAAHVASLEATIKSAREDMKAVVAERREVMGPAVAKAMDDALLAAAIKVRPGAQDGGLKGRIQNAFSSLNQSFQTVALAVDENDFKAHALCTALESWGLDSSALAPELQELLEKPVDTKTLDQAISEFHPPAALKEPFDAEMSKLLQPGASPRVASAAIERFTKGIDALEPGTRLGWSFDSHAEFQAPVHSFSPLPVGTLKVLLTGGGEKTNQLQVSRDKQGYQLVLRSGSGATGGVALQAVGAITQKYFSADATASIAASGHNMTGIALRFPDSDAGRADLKKLLDSLLTKGEMDIHDLATPHQALPVVEQMRGGNATVGVRLNANLPLTSVPVRNQPVAVNATPQVYATATAGLQTTHTTYANTRQQVHEQVDAFSFKVATAPQMKMSAGVASMGGLERAMGLGSLLPDSAMAAPVPIYGKTLEHVDASCKMTTKDVREQGLLTADTERTASLSGLPKGAGDAFPRLVAGALDTLGGPELKALSAHLQSSKTPKGEALRESISSLLKTAGPNDEVRLTWRIDPKVQGEVNALLQEARATAGRQMGHADPKEAEAAASQLEARAKALVADQGSYRLHGLELVAHENTKADVGAWSDLSKMSLGYLSWGKRVEGAHERVFASVQFDPEILDAAKRAAAAD